MHSSLAYHGYFSHSVTPFRTCCTAAEMTCREAVVEAAKILHRCHDEDGKPFDIEMSWICDESKRQHERVPPAIASAAIAAAKAALEDSDMDAD